MPDVRLLGLRLGAALSESPVGEGVSDAAGHDVQTVTRHRGSVAIGGRLGCVSGDIG